MTPRPIISPRAPVLFRTAAAFCAELGADRERLKAVACGYFLLIARKVL